MSKSETIGKLEALLARVRSRAAIAAPPSTPARVGAAPAPNPAPEKPLPELDEVNIAQAAPTAPEFGASLDVELDQDSGETVIEVSTDEVVIGESLDSRERLVAAEPVAAESMTSETPEESPLEILETVEEEQAPLSSRRPVALQPEERLADMAFGDEEPRAPRHTPPPESGRLPAAPALEFDGDVTGVREATPLAPRRELQEARPKNSPTESQGSRELFPEATRADLSESDAVAKIVGEAQGFAPPTFAALLDASMAL